MWRSGLHGMGNFGDVLARTEECGLLNGSCARRAASEAVATAWNGQREPAGERAEQCTARVGRPLGRARSVAYRRFSTAASDVATDSRTRR